MQNCRNAELLHLQKLIVSCYTHLFSGQKWLLDLSEDLSED